MAGASNGHQAEGWVEGEQGRYGKLVWVIWRGHACNPSRLFDPIGRGPEGKKKRKEKSRFFFEFPRVLTTEVAGDKKNDKGSGCIFRLEVMKMTEGQSDKERVEERAHVGLKTIWGYAIHTSGNQSSERGYACLRRRRLHERSGSCRSTKVAVLGD
ncbi:hypothetical protein SODALDRAFT_165643 [Sodiomyces alkalinus F11]|uniref:Uncharacterized protein n=1 Tax=Sodiomyces alkalinus (strain CBS 110278 / VKM F-3762 / F11) TaxID=1314773 RepID=A0A3N2PVT0_SODAK|nr:hypothetical protein SODALDRAFT_165643 [Sodiomyces alkalinus F11]ROT38582.1 hypothetical protein SODALDRAFT_165643 [Sodiomyces alkalinus F11]